VALLDALSVDRAILAGYSMGGPVAQLAWHRHRGRVAGLVLCATAGVFRSTPMEHTMFAGLAGLAGVVRITPEALRRQVGARVLGGRHGGEDAVARWARAEVRRHDPAMVVQAGHAIGRFSSLGWVGEVDVPATVVLTRRDRLVPPARQSALARAIPDATIHHVEGDHLVCADRPDRFVPALRSACLEVADRAGTS
jgi:pimeloyl-ACP methyl ester carboxylesterase